MTEIAFSLLLLFAGVISAETANTLEAYTLGACTIKTRIDAGWAPENVMNHYYAPYVKPSDEQVDIMRQVLAEEVECPPVYFAYSKAGADAIFGDYDGVTVCDERGFCNVFMTVAEYREAMQN